eukprot:2406794-Amphidinium_carterae.1
MPCDSGLASIGGTRQVAHVAPSPMFGFIKSGNTHPLWSESDAPLSTKPSKRAKPSRTRFELRQ